MDTIPHILTWALALFAAGLALAGSLGKVLGFISASLSNTLTLIAYAFLGLSTFLFIIRGFWGSP